MARRALVLILLVALLARVGAAAVTTDYKLVNDAADYDRVARSVADGHGYPSTNYAAPGTPAAWRDPGYPVSLAGVYAVFGRSLTAGRLFSAVLGALAVLLIFLVTRELWDRRTGLVAAAVAAIFPPLLALNTSLISEALFVPLVLAAVLAVLLYRRQSGRNLRWALAAGVLGALAALTRSAGILLPLVMAVGVLTAPERGGKRRIAAAAVLLAAAVLTIAPWTLRNARALHSFVPISTTSGLSLAGTYNPVTASAGSTEGLSYPKGLWYPPFRVPEFRHLWHGTLNEGEIDRILRRDALRYATDHPVYPAEVAALNTMRLFGVGPGHTFSTYAWYNEMGVPRRARPWTTRSLQLLTLVALVGVFAMVTRRLSRPSPAAFVWLVPIVLLFSTVFLVGGIRYRAPLDPFLVMLASVPLTALATRLGLTELRLTTVRTRTTPE
jgi:hypothetical protein